MESEYVLFLLFITSIIISIFSGASYLMEKHEPQMKRMALVAGIASLILLLILVLELRSE